MPSKRMTTGQTHKPAEQIGPMLAYLTRLRKRLTLIPRRPDCPLPSAGNDCENLFTESPSRQRA